MRTLLLPDNVRYDTIRYVDLAEVKKILATPNLGKLEVSPHLASLLWEADPAWDSCPVANGTEVAVLLPTKPVAKTK